MIIASSFPKLFSAWAITIAPFIFVVPEHINDTALIEHEKVHFKEQLEWLVIPWWASYLLSSNFRKNAELRAYKVQIKLGGCSVQQAAYWLSNNYSLSISQKEAEILLVKK